MDKKGEKLSIGFKVKVILAFFVFSAVMSSVLSISAYKVLYSKMFQEIQGRAKDVAHLGSYLIDRKALNHLTQKMSADLSEQQAGAFEQSDDFRLLSDQVNRIRDIERGLIRYVYLVHPGEGMKSSYIVDTDATTRFNSEFETSSFPVYRRAVQEMQVLVERDFVYDPVLKETSITAYAPIMDDGGKTLLAVLCVDVMDTNVAEALRNSKNVSFSIMAASILLSFIISVILGNMFSKGIHALDQVVQRFSRKDFAARASVRTNDEIGRLGFSLNYMAETIQNYAARLENLLVSYSRFVPKNFLQFLNKDSITDVQLGDQIQQEMTVLFADIRSFTTLSESMTPRENFNFLNSYLKRVGPVIRFYNGFIDKYIGDGIMALFPGDPDDAVMAAIEMINKVEEYNGHRMSSGYQPIRIGVGIHTGMLMLGTIGEDERMDGSVISDAVNLCSRMEGLTKTYGSSIIISRETLDKTKNYSSYKIRFLDKVQVKGRHIPVSLYEVYNADPPELIEYKNRASQAWEQGIQLYFDSKLSEALSVFVSLQKDLPDDTLIRLYAARCEQYLAQGIPQDWHGITAADSK